MSKHVHQWREWARPNYVRCDDCNVIGKLTHDRRIVSIQCAIRACTSRVTVIEPRPLCGVHAAMKPETLREFFEKK